MKRLEEYMAILRQYLNEKSTLYGIAKMGIFSSVARNEQNEDSDVDVYVSMMKIYYVFSKENPCKLQE